MVKKEVILSLEGMQRLEQELNHLKTVRRQEVADRIRQARAFGDISENSEYENAKNDQAFLEGRIISLEKILRNARVLEESEISTETVCVGCKVTLKDLGNGDLVDYTIVHSTEADPAAAKISDESPVGQALIGHRVGETITVRTPVGTFGYELLAINPR